MTATIPAELLAALPAGTDIARCETTTYAAVYDRTGDGPGGHEYDQAIVIILPGWTADDGNADVQYPGADDGADAAQEYVDSGDWGEITETTWISVHVWRQGYMLDEDGELVGLRIDADTHTIEITPDEPDCDGDQHDWRSPYSVLGGLKENPGVWGKGGGVIIKEVCAHCGRYRITDTWAQNRQTGEQGLESVRYEDADEDSIAWVQECRDREYEG